MCLFAIELATGASGKNLLLQGPSSWRRLTFKRRASIRLSSRTKCITWRPEGPMSLSRRKPIRVFYRARYGSNRHCNASRPEDKALTRHDASRPEDTALTRHYDASRPRDTALTRQPHFGLKIQLYLQVIVRRFTKDIGHLVAMWHMDTTDINAAVRCGVSTTGIPWITSCYC